MMKIGLYLRKFTFIIFFQQFFVYYSHPKVTENQQFQQQIGVLLEGRSKLAH